MVVTILSFAVVFLFEVVQIFESVLNISQIGKT